MCSVIFPFKIMETAKVQMVNVTLQGVISILRDIKKPSQLILYSYLKKVFKVWFKLCDFSNLLFGYDIDRDSHGLIFRVQVIILVNILCGALYNLRVSKLENESSGL